MAKLRHPVPLTAKTVDEFVDWAGSAPMSDVDVVRRSIADSCDDDVVAALGRELNTLPIVDTSRHNMLLSILGESRREAAIQPLERFIWNVVDVLAPVQIADVTVLSHQVVCDIGFNVGLAFRGRAAEMLTYIATARAFDGAMRVSKVINSLYLICYGLSNVTSAIGGAPACSQWHSTDDYRDLVTAVDNRFHGPFYVRFIEYNGSKPADTELRRFLARDRTNLHCPLFNIGSNVDSPTIRAAAFLHEAWHHWQYEHDFDPSHLSCSGGDCDWYYVNHPWTPGQMHTHDLNPASFRFLSPYQVMVDYLDDIHIFHRSQVPISAVLDARTEGNAVLTQKFRNTPKFRIGSPKPF